VPRAGGDACDAGYGEYDPGRGHRAVDVPLGLDGGRKDLPVRFTMAGSTPATR